MLCYVSDGPNGCVAVTYLDPRAAERKKLRILSRLKNPHQYDTARLPRSRRFRNAWIWLDGEVKVDMEKARDLAAGFAQRHGMKINVDSATTPDDLEKMLGK